MLLLDGGLEKGEEMEKPTTYEIKTLGTWVPVTRGNLVKGWLHWERQVSPGSLEFGMACPGYWREAKQEPQEPGQEAAGAPIPGNPGSVAARPSKPPRKAARKGR